MERKEIKKRENKIAFSGTAHVSSLIKIRKVIQNIIEQTC
jgi:hypothetical protein